MIYKRIALYLSIILCFSCSDSKQKSPEFIIAEPFPIEQILERGTLNIATSYNTTDYYVYKGITRGFHYELAQDFADFLGVKLQIVDVTDNSDEAIEKLQEDKFDILAVSLTETPERKEKVDFTQPFFQTGDALVQHKGENQIHHLRELDGQEIFIQQHAPAKKLLQHIEDSLKIKIRIIEVEQFSHEDLLHLVATGEISYTVIDENIAKASAFSMKNLDCSVRFNNEVSIAWATNKESESLTEALNEWLAIAKKSSKFNFLYNRYFNNSKSVPHHSSKYSIIKKGSISPFDDMLKKESKVIGWDWRLLAALVYTESQFNPEAESPYGAFGLMQLTLETAELFKVSDYFLPDSNIYAGVRYLKYLDNMFVEQVPDSWERLKFTLASYNAGAGHVLDAIRLAEKHGKDQHKWEDNVAYCLLNKSNPEFYRDPVVRNGYCNGKQATEYVHRVLETYNNYKNISPGQ